jgi:hypothetical protein
MHSKFSSMELTLDTSGEVQDASRHGWHELDEGLLYVILYSHPQLDRTGLNDNHRLAKATIHQYITEFMQPDTVVAVTRRGQETTASGFLVHFRSKREARRNEKYVLALTVQMQQGCYFRVTSVKPPHTNRILRVFESVASSSRLQTLVFKKEVHLGTNTQKKSADTT